MRALIFFRRKSKSQELSRDFLESLLGELSHFEKVGMVLSTKAFDYSNLLLFLLEAGSTRLLRVRVPPLSTKVITYYITKE